MNPVYFYYPNLIGYFRVISCILALHYALDDYYLTAFFYAMSQGLDAVDGVVARYMNQSTKFGQVLDMLTDRASTTALMCVFIKIYPNDWKVFTGLIVLDVVSHWYQTYAKMLEGKTTHKGSDNFLLNFYYSFPALLICCVGNEGCFVVLYLLKFTQGPLVFANVYLFELVFYVFLPISIFKNFMNVVQLYDAASVIATLDLQDKLKQSKEK